MQMALSSISGNIARIAIAQRKWDLIADFEEISQQAVGLTANLSSEVEFTEAESAAFEKLIAFVIGVVKKHKIVGIYSLLFIDMVLRIASFHQYFDFLKAKPELVTKEEFGKFERKLLQSIQEKLIEEKQYQITNRVCKIRLKPKLGALVLAKLPEKFELIILQVNHKWVYVSFTNPRDHLSQTGWVQKKFLFKKIAD
jgi:hypothetical protein